MEAVEYYSAIKINKIVQFAKTWMDLETVRDSEYIKSERGKKNHVLMHICGI